MSNERVDPVPIPSSPYRGLESFDVKERDYFFGREVERETIGANLITSKLTIFYGTSGVGKTSVLRAGVIPFVRAQPDVTVLLFRSWREATFELLFKQEVAAEVKKKSGEELDLTQPLDRCLAEAAKLTRGTIAVIFDQFEEYMLYHPASSPEGREFDAGFSRAVNREEIDANFLIAIREDALARLDRFRHAIPDLLGNRLRLDHLDADGARAAIRKPLARYNDAVRAHGHDNFVMNVEDDLVEELIRQVRIGGINLGTQGHGRVEGVVAATRVETPFLQMVLQRMWEAERGEGSHMLRLQTLRGLGGAQKIVRDHVEVVMQRLTRVEREAASRIFDRLVTPSGTKIAYSESDLAQFADNARVSAPQLLATLAQVRILRAVEPSEPEGETRYEIFHDILSSAVLQWRARYQRNRELARRIRKVIGIAVPVIIVAGVMLALYVRDVKNRERIALVLANTESQKVDLETKQRRVEEQLAIKTRDLQALKNCADFTALLNEKLREAENLGASYRRNDDFTSALSAYRQALDIQKQLGDTEGQKRSAAAIDSTLQEREWDATLVLQTLEGDVMPTDATPQKTCGLYTLGGEWIDGKTAWRLIVRHANDVTSLEIHDDKMTASGTLTRENIDAPFTGTINFKNGSPRRVSIPLPEGSSGCNSIKGRGISLWREIDGHQKPVT